MYPINGVFIYRLKGKQNKFDGTQSSKTKLVKFIEIQIIITVIYFCNIVVK